MSVWLYQNYLGWLDQLILWDGENTYWTEEMKPSGGYGKMRESVCPVTGGRFIYIGEFD